MVMTLVASATHRPLPFPTPVKEGMGDEAIREFVTTQYSRVVAAVAFATGDRDGAEDAVQDAVVKTLAGDHRPDNLAAWVTVVAINAARGRQRRSRSEEKAVMRSEPPAAEPSQDAVADRLTLLDAVERLPDGQRTVILLHYYLDVPVSEVAGSLGVTEGTVKTQLHRGRASLAAALGEEP